MTPSRLKIIVFSIDSNFFFNNVAIHNKARAQPKLSLFQERSSLNGSLEYAHSDGVCQVVMS